MRHNYKKIKFLNLTIKELHHISLILLSNKLSITNNNYHLYLIKYMRHNYKKIKYINFKFNH